MVKGRRTNETKESTDLALPVGHATRHVTRVSHVHIPNVAQYRQRSQMKFSLSLTETLEKILNAEFNAAHDLVDKRLRRLVQLRW